MVCILNGIILVIIGLLYLQFGHNHETGSSIMVIGGLILIVIGCEFLNLKSAIKEFLSAEKKDENIAAEHLGKTKIIP